MPSCEGKNPRGRPRGFDKDQALQIAMEVFMQKGYRQTSLNDLTEALQVKKPSLYAAFGNKEQLFQAVVKAYVEGPVSYVRESLNQPTSRDVIKVLLKKSVDLLFLQVKPNGCLAIMSTAVAELEDTELKAGIIQKLRLQQDLLEERFVVAIENGDLPAKQNPTTLASMIATLHKGLSLQAIGGSEKNELMAVVDAFVELWPGK
ncbi:transcriptional regulator, TetR family [Methylobacillus rhizosphaerae]|uniref:Transcriptional regulator, TetR family n=1 Tax=Methylobacillus rhizosphaerae TaxID=551994 RepID=A0A239B128_9PROT|nr:TetR/AcrR family transcriptional regulator [Methylobacillus rhizosphaerae]SNS01510.1 transcriptional regulator, TetR family [Methylobacillus rhizosphaerae]